MQSFQKSNQEVSSSKLKVEVVKEMLPISLQEFMHLFVNDDANFSLKRYHESVNDADVEISKWSMVTSPPNQGHIAPTKCRKLNFLTPVNIVGLKSNTKGTKTQVLRIFGDDGLILSTSTRMNNVPASDCFTVKDALIVKALSNSTVEVHISTEVQFNKGTLLKNMIESITIREMKDWLRTYFSRMKQIATKDDL